MHSLYNDPWYDYPTVGYLLLEVCVNFDFSHIANWVGLFFLIKLFIINAMQIYINHGLD